jgi:hypothetical protein
LVLCLGLQARAGVKMVNEIGPGIPFVRGDTGRIIQVRPNCTERPFGRSCPVGVLAPAARIVVM